MENIPDYQDVLNAAKRLDGIVRKTPLIENQILNSITGSRVFIKPENLQMTGSFKFRGAYNAISSLSNSQQQRGVVACSSGNHAQGIAEAARLMSTPATIIMPEDSPKIKLQRTKRSGAHVITYNRANGDRDAIASEICAKNDAEFIHPYNNSDVIAGQGTTGLEIAHQFIEDDNRVDRLFVCTGGGGLTGGLTLAITHHFPGAKIHSVEPEGFDDYRRSLIAGRRLDNPARSGSICDALLSQMPGEMGFDINRSLLAEGFTVSDEQVLGAIRFAFNELKIVVEPGGAVALAALLNNPKKWSGETIACIISGGNIDPEMMTKALS
jgi:threonine dehydratase